MRRHSASSSLASVLFLGCTLFISGCNALEEHEHCKKLALLLDPPLAAIQADVQGQISFSPEQLITQAERYEQLTVELNRERAELGALGKNVRNLASEFQGVARALRDAARAQTQNKPESYRSADAQLRFTNQRIQDLRAQLSRRCQAR